MWCSAVALGPLGLFRTPMMVSSKKTKHPWTLRNIKLLVEAKADIVTWILVHSGKLTWQRKVDPLKMNYLLKMVIFQPATLVYQRLFTLPETNSSHLPGSHPKRKHHLLFRCELLVSGRVNISPWDFWGNPSQCHVSPQEIAGLIKGLLTTMIL